MLCAGGLESVVDVAEPPPVAEVVTAAEEGWPGPADETGLAGAELDVAGVLITVSNARS